MRSVVAKKVYTITYEGTDDAYIQLADQLAQGLDSLDLGDATGAYCQYADEHDADSIGEHIVAGPGIAVTISTDWELFQWDVIA